LAPQGLCCPLHQRYYDPIRPSRRLPPTSQFITGYRAGLRPAKSSGLPSRGSQLCDRVPFMRAAIPTPEGGLTTSPQLFISPTGLPHYRTGSAPSIPRHRLLSGRDHDAAMFALCYGPHDCLPPCADPTQSILWPTGTFTPELSQGWSPFLESGMTTRRR